QQVLSRARHFRSNRGVLVAGSLHIPTRASERGDWRDRDGPQVWNRWAFITRRSFMKDKQVKELALQALETELGGVEVYKTALQCVVNDDLREEWEEYLEQTQRHVEIVTALVAELGLDPEEETPGRL